MAMKEFKSCEVAPNEESKTIERYQSFGWELKGAPQEIRTQDSQVFTGQDSDGTEHYRTIKGVHYIKISFERDPARPNYEELKSLEAEYEALKNPYYPYKPKIFFGALVTIICVVLWIVILSNFFDKFPLVGTVIFIGFLALLIFRLATYPKRRKVWKNELEEYNNELNAVNSKREEILSKAQSLV